MQTEQVFNLIGGKSQLSHSKLVQLKVEATDHGKRGKCVQWLKYFNSKIDLFSMGIRWSGGKGLLTIREYCSDT